MGKVISGVCDLCLCVSASVSALRKKNYSSNQHQTWYAYGRTSASIDPGVERSKVKVTRCYQTDGVGMQVDTTAWVRSGWGQLWLRLKA